MTQIVSELLNLTPGTIYLISIVCGLSLVALKDVLPNLLVGVVIYPLAVATALLAMAGLTELHLIPLGAFAAWLLMAILSSAAGMGMALLALVLANRLSGFLVASRMRSLAPSISIRHVSVGRSETD